MNMDDDGLTPAPGALPPVGTFTRTAFRHPDEDWHPLGAETAVRPAMRGEDVSVGQDQDEAPERPAGEAPGFDLHGNMGNVRAALRGV